MRFKDILLRITGISTPMFGVSWNPPQSERETVRRFISYVEDRRTLFYPLKTLRTSHIPWGICDSVLEIRSLRTDEYRKYESMSWKAVRLS